MRLSATDILHKAFSEALGRSHKTRDLGNDAFVPQLLRDAERYLRGETLASPGLHTRYFVDMFEPHSPSHTCMDFPNMQCPACAGVGFRHAGLSKESL